MISESYRVGDFMDAVKDMDYGDMLVTTQKEINAAMGQVEHVKPVRKYRGHPATSYFETLKGFYFLLSHGRKPDGVYDHIFVSFRPAIESLVKRGQMKPEALDVFELKGED